MNPRSGWHRRRRAVALGLALLVAGIPTARAQPVENPQAEAARAMERGGQAMARGDFEIAIGHFRAAKRLLPESAGPRLELGLALRSNLMCREALSELEVYRRLKPAGDAQSQRAVAHCRRVLGLDDRGGSKGSVILVGPPTAKEAPSLLVPPAASGSLTRQTGGAAGDGLPLYKRWFFWTLLGAAIGSGVTVGVVFARRGR